MSATVPETAPVTVGAERPSGAKAEPSSKVTSPAMTPPPASVPVSVTVMPSSPSASVTGARGAKACPIHASWGQRRASSEGKSCASRVCHVWPSALTSNVQRRGLRPLRSAIARR